MNMNFKKNILFLATFVLPIMLLSHPERCHEQERERIQSEKVAYLTNQLDLSVKEAQLFWPVYNEFNNKNDQLFEEQRTINRNLRHKKGEYSEIELEQMLDRLIEIKLEQAKLEKQYHEKYKEILNPEKIVLLYQAEFGFRRHLLRRYQNHPDRRH